MNRKNWFLCDMKSDNFINAACCPRHRVVLYLMRCLWSVHQRDHAERDCCAGHENDSMMNVGEDLREMICRAGFRCAAALETPAPGQTPIAKFILKTKTKVKSHIHESILKTSSFSMYPSHCTCIRENVFFHRCHSVCKRASLAFSPPPLSRHHACRWHILQLNSTMQRSSAVQFSIVIHTENVIAFRKAL